jgi:hypothetical protein
MGGLEVPCKGGICALFQMQRQRRKRHPLLKHFLSSIFFKRAMPSQGVISLSG